MRSFCHGNRPEASRRDGRGGHRRHAGLSLVEVAITMALLGIILSIGLPAFRTTLGNMRVRQVAESLRDGLQTARNEAVKRNAAVAFNLDNATGGGWSVTLVSDGTLLRSKAAAEGSYVLVSAGGAMEVDFSNLGLMTLPAAPSQTFSVSNPGVDGCAPGGSIRCLSIVVAAGGQVRLCDPLRTSPDPQAC